MKAKYGKDTGYLTAREMLECMPVMTINKQPTNYNYPLFASQFRCERSLTTQTSTNKQKLLENDGGNMDNEDYYATAREYSTSDDNAGGFNNFPDSDTEQRSFDEDNSASNTKLQSIFNNYVKEKKQNCLPFTQQERISIELMLTLCETTASLRHYDEIMKWHFVTNNKLESHQKLLQGPQAKEQRRIKIHDQHQKE